MIKKLISVFFIILFIGLTKPCQAVTKCYKDICVGDSVLVIEGVYKENYVRILDIIKERTPDDEKEGLRDYYIYYASLNDGTTLELYRDQLTNRKLNKGYELGFKVGAICGSIFGSETCIEMLNKYFVK